MFSLYIQPIQPLTSTSPVDHTPSKNIHSYFKQPRNKMSDSEATNADSNGNFRPFVALGFHRAVLDPATGGIKEEMDHITDDSGIDPNNPLVLPPGPYAMALHIMGETPENETKPDGTIVEYYKHEKWQFTVDSESHNASTDSVKITAVLNSTDRDPLDCEPSFKVMPSKDSSIQLGMINLQRTERLTVMLVGSIHKIFLYGDSLMFQPFQGNLQYHIQVTDRAE